MLKVALLFPGQGSQYAGMARDLIHAFPLAREAFEEASESVGFDVGKLCSEQDMSTLTRTEFAQPAILTMSVATFRVLEQETKLIPNCMAGHSLGEYSALSCSGALSLGDAVKLVHKRGQFMADCALRSEGAMMAIIDCAPETVYEVCNEINARHGVVVTSNLNSSKETIISGIKSAVIKAGNDLEQKGAKTVLLKVGGAFHSPLMHEASEFLANYIEENIRFSPMKYPVFSNVTAAFHDPVQLKSSLINQVINPIRWFETIQVMREEGITHTVEVGPKQTLTKLIQSDFPDMTRFSTENVNKIHKIIDVWGRGETSRQIMTPTQFINKCLLFAVSTKNRNEKYALVEKEVADLYRELRHIQDEVLLNDDSEHALIRAHQCIKSILKHKNTSSEEYKSRINELSAQLVAKNLIEEEMV
ncbi:ACP S-malonyltransferase [Paenibacillus amylolyticus]|uniref:ACP S-malonyltransferase n=1 Tax=Paenibacillus amylolyticus TaxID=1451 RepID=UPI003EBB05C6